MAFDRLYMLGILQVEIRVHLEASPTSRVIIIRPASKVCIFDLDLSGFSSLRKH